MSKEDLLKELILSQYRSIREFAIVNDFPIKTVDSILRRGVMNSGLDNVAKMCACLGISVDALVRGSIVPLGAYEALSPAERNIITAYRKADARGKQAISDTAARERGFSRSEGSEDPDDRPPSRPELDAVLKAAGSRARQQPTQSAQDFEMRE